MTSYDASGPALGAKNTVMHKTKSPQPQGVYILVGKTDNKQLEFSGSNKCNKRNKDLTSFFVVVINLFIYLYFLFLAALGLCCCAQAFSSCGRWGLLFVAVHGLLIVVASLVAEHRLYAHRLQ